MDIIDEVYNAGSGHPGGSLSCADIISYLYFYKMKIFPGDPHNESRDRFVLSKGHCAPALYAALARSGYFPTQDLKTLRKLGSHLQGHPDMHMTPGVEISTGSLGLGVSNACGIALAGKLNNRDYRVYCLTGDGELQEGQVWEAAMFASHYKLDNLIIFVDSNNLQIDGKVSDVMGVEPIDKRFEAFGFNTRRVNGHDFEQIDKAVDELTAMKGAPGVIVCNTVKGKGVSFMEDKASWHGTAPKKDDYERAILELSAELEKII